MQRDDVSGITKELRGCDPREKEREKISQTSRDILTYVFSIQTVW